MWEIENGWTDDALTSGVVRPDTPTTEAQQRGGVTRRAQAYRRCDFLSVATRRSQFEAGFARVETVVAGDASSRSGSAVPQR